MPTAFLTASTFEVLPFLGTPGAATVGHTLLWSESPKGFTLAPITVGPDQFSGVLPVEKGGWGTNTGSFTSPGAITLAAGGTDQGINLNTSGTGIVSIAADDFKITQRSNTNTALKGVSLFKGNNFFQAINGSGDPNTFWPIFYGKSNLTDFPSLAFLSSQTPGTDYLYGSIWFRLLDGFGNGAINPSHKGFVFSNNVQSLLTIMGGGDSTFHSTTESTSTTTGAVRIDGGLGVAKSLYAAATSGSKVNFANLPTASTGLNPGDLWRDSNGFLRIV